MKTTITLILSIAFSAISWGQEPCVGGRYSTNLFPNVTVTSGITFGSNVDVWGANQTLMLDVYEPTGDTETARPLIIWVHGGSFIGGTRTDSDMVALSNDFAEKGYVCASIDYRVGMWPIDSTNALIALLRSVHDLKAAVRFFYQDRATSDTYKIDTTKIFIGGSSAGAITSLHMAYLDKVCEAEEFIAPATLTSMGGIAGTSGNPAYSSDVAGVINIAGALGRYGYIETGDVPVVSLHGNNDGTVPYNRDIAAVSGFPIMYLDGSRMIHEGATDVGVQSNFYTYYGQDHVPHAGSAQYMDTTINFIRDFLIDNLGCTDTPLLAPNTPLETANLYQLYYCDLGLTAEVDMINAIYPNPATEEITIEFKESGIHVVKLIDLTGRTIISQEVNTKINSIGLNNVQSGSYILNVSNESGVLQSSSIIVQ